MGIPMLTVGIRRYTTAQNRGFAFGLYYSVMNIAAFVSGPVVDLFNIKLDHVHLFGRTLSGNRAVILTATMTSLCSWIITFTCLREIKMSEGSGGVERQRQERQDHGVGDSNYIAGLEMSTQRNPVHESELEYDEGDYHDNGFHSHRNASNTYAGVCVGEDMQKERVKKEAGCHAGEPTTHTHTDTHTHTRIHKQTNSSQVHHIDTAEGDAPQQMPPSVAHMFVNPVEASDEMGEECANPLTHWPAEECKAEGAGEHMNGHVCAHKDSRTSTAPSSPSSSSSAARPSGVQVFTPQKQPIHLVIKELLGSKTFWRFMAFTLILSNLKTIFRHLDATLPTYLVRSFG
jgi:hypothetical protein